jgi:hypothetical protein
MGTVLLLLFPAAARAEAARDTVPLEWRRMLEMRYCAPVGEFVVQDSADLARLRGWPGCGDVPAPDLETRTAVGVPVVADCHARLWLEAARDDTAREVRVTLVKRYGGCRGGRVGYAWVSLPKPPPGYAVRVGERRELPCDGEGDCDDADGRAWGEHIADFLGELMQGEASGDPRADTVHLARVVMHGCEPIGEVVLDAPEDVARLRERGGCRDVPADLDLSDRTIVGVSTHADCSGAVTVSARRSAADRTVYVTRHWYDGGARAMCRSFYNWYALPRLPAGWRVAFGTMRHERRRPY